MEKRQEFEFVSIEKIEVEDGFEGDVFTLQTENEEFIAEGIVVHNCPHTWDIYTEKVTKDECQLLWVG